MGKLNIIKSNFTGGEIDPRLRGRVDSPRYANGMATCENAYPLVTGGVTRRPGLRFVDNDGAGKTVRLIPFNILRSDVSPAALQGYIVEFRSDNLIHFYTNGALIKNGGADYSIASPFTSTDLFKIRYAQFNNILYLVHPDFAPQMLVRTTDTSWSISDVSITMNPAFNAQSPIGVSQITRSGSVATVTTGAVSGSTTTVKNIYTVDPVTGLTNPNFSVDYTTNTNYSGVAHGYKTGQFVRIAGAVQAEYNGDFQITVIDPTTFTYSVAGAPATPATGTITATGIIGITRSGSIATAVLPAPANFKSNQLMRMAGAGQAEYNGDFAVTVVDSTHFTFPVTGTPATPATGTITAQPLHWNAATGYPAAITFFEQRMILAGTKAAPQTVWGSESGNLTNFSTGTGDSDPFKFLLSAATSQIVQLTALKHIFIETLDKDMSMEGGTDKPLMPSNVQIKVQTHYGCREKVRPFVIGNELIFITRHGKKLRSLVYEMLSDTYKAPDVSVVSAHLLAAGIIVMAYQAEPVSIIWMVTADGKLLSVTFDRDQDVVAWARHTTDGVFRDVTVIPYNEADQVWVAIERTVNGVTNTYVEVLDSGLNTDAALTGTDATGKTTWTGLTHLEDKTVDILADGVVMPQQVVSGGQIILPRTAKTVEIGLHYDTTIIDLPPEIPGTMGTAQGQAVSVNKITVRLHEAVGCSINDMKIPFRQFGTSILDNNVKPFSGDKFISNIGWAEQGVVSIKQTQPLPFTVLAIIKEVTINGG